MQHLFGYRLTLALSFLAALVAGCGGSSGDNPNEGNHGGTGDDRDGGEDDGSASGGDGGTGGEGGSATNGTGRQPCHDFECGPGLACVVEAGQPLCEGSCADVTCPDGRTCAVRSGVGRCVAVCDPACGPGQRCELDDDDSGFCVDNTCDELACGSTEVCEASPDGRGFSCEDNTCEDDLDCPEDQHCEVSDGICMGDLCKPGLRRCEGDTLMECAGNGAGEITRFTCAGADGYDSECTENGGVGACSCRGDWDCPAYTACVVGRCEGTGREASCFVQPLPFEDVLPSPEPGFPWGGTDADGYVNDAWEADATYTGPVPSRWAWGSPFPRHSQVSTAPVVANLDDDNGDGLINELDFPEIVFTSFCRKNYFDNGVLRALHGGGSAPGSHKFAACGDKVWKEGDAVFEEGTENLLPEASCECDEGSLEPTGGLAVGDLDGDGIPEIAVLGEGDNDVLYLHTNTGDPISASPVTAVPSSDPAISIANVDGQGMAELIAGRALYVLGRDAEDRLVVTHELVGDASAGVNNGQGASSCVADLDGDGRMEIIAGGTAYRVPAAYAGECPADTAGLTGDDRLYCDGMLDVFWDHGTEGFCAIADVLGALPATPGVDPEIAPGPSHPLDGVPEVLLITGGHLRVLDGVTGLERLDVVLDNRDGGPPNVDDFDGDGFPEVATAFDTKYVVHDFQAPTAAGGTCPAWDEVLDGEPMSPDPINEAAGNEPRTPVEMTCVTDSDCGDPDVVCGSDDTCVCLHNGWASTTQDASSRVTGSSVFDFNGDGKAEVVYNDECFFRIYEGPTGRVYQRLASQSPTRIEYPVVADVDNDGNAEVVFSSSTARSQSCPGQGLGDYGNGINVIGEPEDRWVSARRMWNQHSYHVTNVLEGGGIPAREPDSWRSFNGRRYNTYRSNLPPVGNVAPDLVVSGVQVSSPDVACGQALSDTIRITARIENEGDLRVGPGVVVAFLGDDALLGTHTLETSLEPGGELFVRFDHTADSAAALPTEVQVVVDAEGDPIFGTERECHEDNNRGSAPVEPGEAIADLRVEVELLDGECPDRTLRVTVYNEGAVNVPEVVVRLYAGNPAAGGEPLGQDMLVGPVAAGDDSGPVDFEVNLENRSATVFTVVDPDRAVVECDDSNNTAAVPVACASVELI